MGLTKGKRRGEREQKGSEGRLPLFDNEASICNMVGLEGSKGANESKREAKGRTYYLRR